MYHVGLWGNLKRNSKLRCKKCAKFFMILAKFQHSNILFETELKTAKEKRLSIFLSTFKRSANLFWEVTIKIFYVKMLSGSKLIFSSTKVSLLKFEYIRIKQFPFSYHLFFSPTCRILLWSLTQNCDRINYCERIKNHTW